MDNRTPHDHVTIQELLQEAVSALFAPRTELTCRFCGNGLLSYPAGIPCPPGVMEELLGSTTSATIAHTVTEHFDILTRLHAAHLEGRLEEAVEILNSEVDKRLAETLESKGKPETPGNLN